jgi:hypothetical protein
MILEGINIILLLILFYLVFFLIYGIYWMNKEPSKYIPKDIEELKNDSNENTKALEEELSKISIDSEIQIELENFQGFISLGIICKDYFVIDWGNGMIIPYMGSNFKQILPPVVYKSGNYIIKIKANCSSFNFATNDKDLQIKSVYLEKCSELESLSIQAKSIGKAEVKECPKIKLWNLPKDFYKY